MTHYPTDQSSPSPSLPPPSPPPPPAPPASDKKKRRGCGFYSLITLLCLAALALVGALLIVVIGALGMGSMAMQQQPGFFIEETVETGQTRDKIAIIPVHGVITSMETLQSAPTVAALKQQLRQAANDPKVVAIVLDMNTPGGEIVATDEIYHEIQKLRVEHNLPVVTCMRSIAASGGYYLAAGTDWIVANRLTFTGSIGVIIGSYNISELLDKWGIETMVYKSGSKKDIMSMSRPPTPEEQALLEQMIETSFHEFAEIVAQGRDIPLETVKDPAGPIGDGRVISGQQALEIGLVDELGYPEDAIAKAKALAGTPGAGVVRYRPRPTLADILLSAESPEQQMAREMMPHYLPLIQKGRLYYLAPTTF